ncbi:hypothetical protein BDR07DRAFT_1608537 [Suillus spraguei]|nr:hypothetical protein BDR07DRAFT_1608537 [Suillus spraguei]
MSKHICDDPTTIYEFDASTFKTVGAPFRGHTHTIIGLVLSPDSSLLASTSFDRTIKLWAFESRQPLASFDVKSPMTLVLSPDFRQPAHRYICNIPANILASIELAEEPQLTTNTNKPKRSRRAGPLNYDVTHRPVSRNPTTPFIPQSFLTRNQYTFLHFLRKPIPSSSRMDAVCTNKPRNLLDFPATCPLPHQLINPDENSRPTPAPHHPILHHQYFSNVHFPLKSTINLVALSDRSSIAGYYRCSSRAG